MDFIVKIGDDGHQFTITGLTKEDKVAALQDRCTQETNIEVKDQLLLTKKGTNLVASDALALFEAEPLMLQTNQVIQDLRSTAFTIYLFDVSSSECEAASKPYLLSTSQDAKHKVSCEVKYLSELKAMEQWDPRRKEILTNLNANILQHESGLFGHLQIMKGKYIPYMQKIRLFEKLSQELENQVQSFDVLLKMISINYQSTKSKKMDVFKKCKDSLERNSQTVKKFDESIDNLKRIELHPALQSEQQKYLCDIYYKPEAMLKWKNLCINTSQSVKVKLEKTTTYIKKMKKRIKEERNNTIQTCINTYKNHSSQFQQFIQESRPLIVSLVQSTIEEYTLVRQHMLTYADDVEDETSLFYLSGCGDVDKAKQLEESINHISDHLDKSIHMHIINTVNKAIEVFNKLKQTNQSSIVSIFKVMQGFNVEFDQLNDKIKSIDEDVDKMEKDFSYLLNPTQLPLAYNCALQETSRRKEFKEIFSHKYKYLAGMLDTEKESRKRFLGSYGRILPSDFIPQLKHLPPVMSLSNVNFDQDLPDIQGLHSESDSYNEGGDSKKYEQLQREITDLNTMIKKTHSYYSETLGEDATKKVYRELLAMTAKSSLKVFASRCDALAPRDCNLPTTPTNKQEVLFLQSQLQKVNETQRQTQTSIQELKEKLMREQSDAKERMQQHLNVVQSMRGEHAEALNVAQNASKNEYEKLRTKLKYLELDLHNKQQEIDKGVGALAASQRDLRARQEEHEQLSKSCDAYAQQCGRLKEDSTKYLNKCENLELAIVQKNSEITAHHKSHQQLNKDKSSMQEQIIQAKSQYQETTKKIKQLQDTLKGYEDEKLYLKSQCDKYKAQHDQAHKELQSVRSDISRMNFGQQQNIEIIENQIQTKDQLIESLQQCLLDAQTSEAQKDEEINTMDKELSDLKIIHEQMEIEQQIQQAKIEELDTKLQDNSTTQNDQYETQLGDLRYKMEQLNQQIVKMQMSNGDDHLQHQEEQSRMQSLLEVKTQDILQLHSQIDYLSTKFESSHASQIQLLQNKLSLLDERVWDLCYKRNCSVKIGKSSIFLPVNGSYVPLVLKNINCMNLSTCTSPNQEVEQSFSLDMNSLPTSQRSFMIDTGLIMIADVKSITNTNDTNQISVEPPRFMIGFEDQDLRLKSFII